MSANRDQATVLLSEIDPGKITDAQRTSLIDAAVGEGAFENQLRDAASRGGSGNRDREMER